jgi:tetratricopeptide (TPR) repeat protein
MSHSSEGGKGLVTFFRRLTVKAAGGVGRFGLEVVGSSVFMGAWPVIKAALDPVIALIEDKLDERIDASPEAAERGAQLLAADEQLQALLHDALASQLSMLDTATRESNRGVQALMVMVGGVEERLDDIEGHLVDLGALLEAAFEGGGVRLSEPSVARIAEAFRHELARAARVVALATGAAEGVAPPERQLWLPVDLVDRQVARIIARAGELLQAREPARALDELGDGTLLLSELLRKTPSSTRLQLLGGYLRGKRAEAWQQAGDRVLARTELEAAVELFQMVLDQPGETVTSQELAEAANGLGGVFATLSEHEHALPLHRQATMLAPDYIYAWHDVLGAYINLMQLGRSVDVAEMRLALERVEGLGGGRHPAIGEGHLALLRKYVERAERAEAAGLPPGPDAERILQLTAELASADDESQLRLLQDRAGHHLRMGRFDQACADAETVLDIDDRSVPALRIRAFVRLKRGDAGSALDDLNRLVALGPADSATRCLRAQARRERGDPEAALADANEAVRLDPESPLAHLERAHALASLDRADEAVAAADRALVLDPSRTEARAIRALVNAAADRLEVALADLDAALEGGAAPDLLAMRATILERLRRPGEAVAGFDRALAQRPDVLDWRRALARNLVVVGDQARAEREWAAIIAAEPDDLDARRAHVQVCLALHRPADALADCDAVLAARPDDTAVLMVRGLGRRGTGDLADAVADLSRCLTLGVPDRAVVLAARASCHRLAGDLSAAAADLDAAVAAGAGTEYRAERGLVRLELGDLDGAIDDLAAAHAGEPGDEELAGALAGAYNRRGEPGEAARVLDAAVGAASDNPFLKRMRAAYRLERGERVAALADLDDVIRSLPGDVKALGLRAAVRMQFWQLDEALADVRAALAALPDDPDLLYQRARIAQLQARPLDALLDLDRAVAALPPTDPRVAGYLLVDRAAVHVELGSLEDAQADVDTASASGDPTPDVLFVHALLRRRQGRPAEALTDLERVVTARPNDADMHYLLALTAWEADDANRARQAIEEALRLTYRPGPSDDPRWLILFRRGLSLLATGDPAGLQCYRDAAAAGAPPAATRNAIDDLVRLAEHTRRTGRDLPLREAGALLRAHLAG